MMRKIFWGLLCCSFWQCQNDDKSSISTSKTTFMPNSTANKVQLKYTESGLLKTILEGEQIDDYSQVKYPFTVFPKGVLVTLLDDQQQKSYISANKATTFSKSSIISLEGNVTITSYDGKTLTTEQLYYDQKNEWFFTEAHFVFRDKAGFLEGNGIDFSKDFSVMNAQFNSGDIDNLE